MRRTVTIDRQLVRDGGIVPVFGPVKDRKNRPRTIPLPDTVLAGLVEHVRVYGLGPDGLLFTNTKGLPIRRTTFSEMWQAAARPLGCIPSGDGFHQLRHFYASLLIHHGESVKVVQDRLGHSSATMTLDTYGHLWPDGEDRTRQAVDLQHRHRIDLSNGEEELNDVVAVRFPIAEQRQGVVSLDL
jgi:integrase